MRFPPGMVRFVSPPVTLIRILMSRMNPGLSTTAMRMVGLRKIS